MQIWVKRVYTPAGRQDGARVLVDRVWPRGVSKEAAQIDEWLRDAAPSTALRKWFGHDPDRWEEFQRRYAKELDAATAAVERLAGYARRGRLTLVYGARDEQHNNAVALKAYLERRLRKDAR